MSKLTRYVLSELLKVFLVTLAGMTFLMLVVGLAQEAIRQGLGPMPIFRLIPYAIPNALRFAVPGTILFATCSVFGRMAAANEITAIKSLGISPLALVKPAWILAFFISLLAVWLNDLAVSWGQQGMRRVILHSVEQIAYGMLRTQRSYSCNRFSINVKRVDGRILVMPTICIQSKDGSPPTVLTAQEAELKSDPEQNLLSLRLTNGRVTVGERVSMIFPDTIEPQIPLNEASRSGDLSGSPSQCPLWRIDEEIREQETHIHRLRQELATEAAYEMLTGDLASLTHESWSGKINGVNEAVIRIHRLETEPWRRWANGFSCLFFVMIGAPLAIRMRNADIWSSFAVCFLPILILYYPLLALGVDRAKVGELPPYSVWLGNVILALVGLWTMRKVLRY
ncbi:MAG: LptF/LptG family permease [Pirellulaceae bacterium]|jgi:lipopolysaccharide export system permease protein|nr:LptF/LptG family permease [Pirellulaceae bacterium]